MSIVSVECNADRYFFGRLLKDKNLIRKERNDTEVIKSITIRQKDKFAIGIIDIDKDKKVPENFLQIYNDDFTKIYKHTVNCQFLILIGPRQFEHWINEFLKSSSIEIESFGFENFNKFMETSKSLKPESNIKFKKTIDYVLNNYSNNSNHILNLEKRLHYLIKSNYSFSDEDFRNL